MHPAREQLCEFAATLPGATLDRPFADDLDTTVARHGAEGKWFALFMNIPKQRLGIDENGPVDIVNLKIDPEESYAVRELFSGIFPAYHMNKRHWISVCLDGSVPQEFCELLVGKSYDLTKSGPRPPSKSRLS